MKKKVLLGSVMLSGAALASQEVQADEVKIIAQTGESTTPQIQSSSKEVVATSKVTPTQSASSEPQVQKSTVVKESNTASVTKVDEQNAAIKPNTSSKVSSTQEISDNRNQAVAQPVVTEENKGHSDTKTEVDSPVNTKKDEVEMDSSALETDSLKENGDDVVSNDCTEEATTQSNHETELEETSENQSNDHSLNTKEENEKKDTAEESKDSESKKADTAEESKDSESKKADAAEESKDSESKKADAAEEVKDSESKKADVAEESKDLESKKTDEQKNSDEENHQKDSEQTISSSKKQKVTSLKENKKKQYTPVKEAKTVQKETLFEKAMRDPESLTQKEINQLTDEEMAELALEGKIYNKQMLESFATRQVYSRSGGQTEAGKAFVKKWGEAARKVANRYGVYASVMMAQAMLESGYGQSELASKHHNLFGIKAGPGYKGKKVLYWTQEFINGQWYTVQDYFRHYDDLESSFEDNAKVIRYGTDWDSSYYKGAWKENCNSYKDAAQWLQGRYATDPTYANKLISIIQTYNLTQFDTPAPSQTNKPSNSTTNNGVIYHTVQRGETLSKIANQYKTSVNKIANDNKIKDVNKISVGQKLKIIQSTTSKPATSKPATSKPVSQSKTYTYTVKRGDTLGKIAKQYKVTVNSIAKENKIKNVNHIYVGQTLKITKKGSSSTTSKSTTTKPTYKTVTHNKTYTYTVKQGDTLGKISKQYDVTVNNIAKENKIKNVNHISVGQKLKITKKVTEKVQVNPTTSKSTTSNSTYKTVKTTQTYTYTVKRGDTLGQIANKNKVTVNSIAKDNKIKDVNKISVGQKLKIKKTVTKKVSTQSSKKTTSSKTTSYTVKRGDTLYSIARRYHVSVSTLVKKNGLRDANQLAIGQKIKIK